MVAKKGSHLVRVHREQTERRKAQKSLDMAGTKMGNILGVEKKDDREDKGTDVIYFSNFFCMFLNPNNFFQFETNCSNLLDMRNLQEQVKKAFCYQK